MENLLLFGIVILGLYSIFITIKLYRQKKYLLGLFYSVNKYSKRSESHGSTTTCSSRDIQEYNHVNSIIMSRVDNDKCSCEEENCNRMANMALSMGRSAGLLEYYIKFDDCFWENMTDKKAEAIVEFSRHGLEIRQLLGDDLKEENLKKTIVKN